MCRFSCPPTEKVHSCRDDLSALPHLTPQRHTGHVAAADHRQTQLRSPRRQAIVRVNARLRTDDVQRLPKHSVGRLHDMMGGQTPFFSWCNQLIITKTAIAVQAKEEALHAVVQHPRWHDSRSGSNGFRFRGISVAASRCLRLGLR